MVYLDTAATAKYENKDDIIVDVMTTAMRDSWMNPSSLYAVNVKNKINKCRANIAEFIGAKTNEIYFTSGASESNNWAIKGFIDNMLTKTLLPVNIITTPIEHKSTLEVLESEALAARVYYCDVDKAGLVDCDSLEYWLKSCKREPMNKEESILVTVCMANNEIGTIQNVKEISSLVHKYNGVLHIDATQAFGHIPIDVEGLGIDMMSASGHKISSVLRGIGFLYKKNCINIHPLIHGAQENNMRGGTENTYGIIGLNKAIEYCDVGRDTINELCRKRNHFIALLKSKFGCELNGHSEYRLPNNINVTFPQNITGESLLYTLDLSGIKVSTSSACNSRAIEPSYVLTSIGLTYEQAIKSVRFTLSNDITYDEIDYTIKEIDKAIKLIEIN